MTDFASIMKRAEWTARAACRDLDPNLFFPRVGDEMKAVDYAPEARAACAGCPVAAECLMYALNNAERYGLWGGKTPLQRRSIRRRLIAQGAIKPQPGRGAEPECGTRSGYNTHRRRGEEACGECRVANTEYVTAKRIAAHRRTLQRAS